MTSLEPWAQLRKLTQARIGLRRSGHALATTELLEFQLAHSKARDAVWRPWDFEALRLAIAAEQELEQESKPILVRTQVATRDEYLKRPDLGRKLSEESVRRLANVGEHPNRGAGAEHKFDLSIIISDGLSAQAVESHALPFWKTVSQRLKECGLTTAPLVFAPFARVAVSDEIGSLLRAKIAVILIGERPGLSASDSLGVYLTHSPRPGNSDAQRNCLSNIRPPEGLSYELAADRLMDLVMGSLRLGLSGVALKEDQNWKMIPK